MNRSRTLSLLAGTLLLATPAMPLGASPHDRAITLGRVEDLELIAARAERVRYRGRDAIHLQAREGHEHADQSMMAVLKGSSLADGTIELDVSGEPQPGLASGARGFIGLAFHVQSPADSGRYQAFYIRPVNARLEDQLTRNHSVQYISMPEYGWERLRTESPGVYESYVDLEPGAWVHLKIEVAGAKARLFVNRAPQPVLIVNDLKTGATEGAIALWSHTTTNGYFANLKVD
jgi:hypothetical protein